jgi:hypothetical protein
MAVPEDDGIGGGEPSPHPCQTSLRRPGIVDDRHGRSTHLHLQRRRQQAPKGWLVNVPVDGVDHRTEHFDLPQDRPLAEVTRMNHRLGSGEDLHASFRQAPAALRHVGVGDDGDQALPQRRLHASRVNGDAGRLGQLGCGTEH